MEVGAVKQAFNNEVILLKKKLSQAKIQIIHKLTRKAKQLTEKKAPEPLKEKLKRKAESAVKEVLILKKIKPKDLAKFIVTHKGELKDFLNKPLVDNDKACARLLLHKALQDKYKSIRGRFSNVPIQDLFMSRLERQKIKKEEKEKRKNKKKGKDNKVVNSEGSWSVENVGIDDETKMDDDNNDELSDEEGNILNQSDLESKGEENESQGDESEQLEAENESDGDAEDANVSEGDDAEDANVSEDDDAEESESAEETSESDIKAITKPVKLSPKLQPKDKSQRNEINIKEKLAYKEIDAKPMKKKVEKKQKDSNKNKNFNEKIQHRKFKKDSDTPVVGNKIVDPFFITSSGENYMSVFEPRGPDEVKEEHKQGNRKLRRAAMFGHVPKIKPRQEYKNYKDNNRFSNENGYERGNKFDTKFNNRREFNDKKQNNDFNNSKNHNNNFSDRKRFNDRSNDEKPEKLHPSWEAKKKKSGILPFEGKKIVFD